MGKKNDGIISKTIFNINCNGEELASRYEEEKEKCVIELLLSKN